MDRWIWCCAGASWRAPTTGALHAFTGGQLIESVSPALPAVEPPCSARHKGHVRMTDGVVSGLTAPQHTKRVWGCATRLVSAGPSCRSGRVGVTASCACSLTTKLICCTTSESAQLKGVREADSSQAGDWFACSNRLHLQHWHACKTSLPMKAGCKRSGPLTRWTWARCALIPLLPAACPQQESLSAQTITSHIAANPD